MYNNNDEDEFFEQKYKKKYKKNNDVREFFRGWKVQKNKKYKSHIFLTNYNRKNGSTKKIMMKVIFLGRSTKKKYKKIRTLENYFWSESTKK